MVLKYADRETKLVAIIYERERNLKKEGFQWKLVLVQFSLLDAFVEEYLRY
jgi:hypothetical protein